MARKDEYTESYDEIEFKEKPLGDELEEAKQNEYTEEGFE